jgi:anti-sigma B factor antagonist
MPSDEPPHVQPDVPSAVWQPPAVERRAPARANGGRPALSVNLEVHTGPGSQILALRFAGEIDLATLPAVRDALAATRNATSCDVVADLAALKFCCARGFALLADAAEKAVSAGTGFAVSGLHPKFERMTALLWSDSAIACHPSATDAVTALRTGRACRPRPRP